mgnify:CR=1 FL=1
MPNQNTGMDWPKAPRRVQRRSSAEPGRTAAPIPSGTETRRTARSVATVARASVAGTRSSTSGSDGVL